MKPLALHKADQRGNVAPYTGAWIETGVPWMELMEKGVAPYTGAWIETLLWQVAERVYGS